MPPCKRSEVTTAAAAAFLESAPVSSALVYPKTLLPLELGDLPYRDSGIIENYLGKPGLAKLGEPAWKRE